MPARPADWPAPADKPPASPIPADYVLPTNPPPFTPFPTLAPDPTPIARAVGETAAEPVVSLPTQVTNYVSTNKNKLDAIVRVKVLSHQDIKTPDDHVWPMRKNPDLYYRDDTPLIRVVTSLEIKETLYGNLPTDYKFMSFKALPNGQPDIGKEYITFVYLSFVGEGEFLDDPAKVQYTDAELGILGGKIATYAGTQTWVIDGANAWRVPLDHIQKWSPGPEANATADSTQLAAAKTHGDSLTVNALKAAIAAGLE